MEPDSGRDIDVHRGRGHRPQRRHHAAREVQALLEVVEDHYDGRIVPDEDPMGRTHFWFTVVPIERTEPGTDLWAMERGYVSVTPLGLDLTDAPALERLSTELPLDVPTDQEPAKEVEEDE